MQTTASLGVLARACLVFSRFWTRTAQPEHESDPGPVQHFDALAAFSPLREPWSTARPKLRGIASRWREGWTPSACEPAHADGTARIELQRLDILREGVSPVFACDDQAWMHVVARARSGSVLHRSALALVGRHERRLIEVACGSWIARPD